MKRLTLFAAALFVAVSSFAAVSYELNGGVTNDQNWQTPQDMWATLNADWNAFSGTSTTWKTLAELEGNFAVGLPTQAGKMDVPFLDDANFKAHFGWLKEYLSAQVNAVGDAENVKDPTVAGNGAYLRYNLAAFFSDGYRGAWPVSANYTNVGVSRPSAYASYWKGGFANPTEPTADFVLNAPYKEGFSFAGWYAAADFSGEQVLTVTPASTGTLYAKWVDAAKTVYEITALTDGADAVAAGTVTQVLGSNLWIEDATGGLLCYTENHGLKAGEYVVLKGKKTTYGGVAELEKFTVLAHWATEPFQPIATTLATLVAKPEAYMSEYISLAGVRVAFNGENVSVTDGTNTLACYKLTLDKSLDGVKIDLSGVFGKYDTTLQLRIDAANVKTSLAGIPEGYDYPARGDSGQYKFTNKWVITRVADNFAANMPNSATGTVRGMAVKNGKLYFPERANKELVIIDGVDGKMLKPVKFADDIFTYTANAGTDSAKVAPTPTTLSFNDIKKDAAGNLLLGSCITNSQIFQIWKVDETTGKGTLVIQEKLWDNPLNDSLQYRFDAFGVYGNVDEHAVIMAVDANSMTAFKWTINGGKQDGNAEMIELFVAATENSYLISNGAMITNPGTAPQVFPVDDDYFYLDGNATFPTLFNMDGTLADDLKNCAAGIKIGNNEGDTCTLVTGHNGLCEFQIGQDYFILFAATNTTGTPNSAFALYKYKDASKSFADLTPLWFFPNKGMGSETNGYRTASCDVEVDQKKGIATIYVYTGENGYACYELQGVPGPVEDGVENITTDDAAKVQKLMENGQVIIIRDGVRYNVLGTQVK